MVCLRVWRLLIVRLLLFVCIVLILLVRNIGSWVLIILCCIIFSCLIGWCVIRGWFLLFWFFRILFIMICVIWVGIIRFMRYYGS